MCVDDVGVFADVNSEVVGETKIGVHEGDATAATLKDIAAFSTTLVAAPNNT